MKKKEIVTVTEPDSIPSNSSDYPTKKLSGTFNGYLLTNNSIGEKWEAEITFKPETVNITWKLKNSANEVVKYAYRKTDGRNTDNEVLGILPVQANLTDDDVVINSYKIETKSYTREKECESTNFTKFLGRYIEDEIDILTIDGDSVPNKSRHLTQIQNQISNSISQTEMIERVEKALENSQTTVE